MSTERKKNFQIKAQIIKVEGLKFPRDQLPPINHGNFDHNYGKILNLLDVPVQFEAITFLAQFYDMPLRCFTFQDFQIAPNLEEFGKILHLGKKTRGPYKGIEKV